MNPFQFLLSWIAILCEHVLRTRNPKFIRALHSTLAKKSDPPVSHLAQDILLIRSYFYEIGWLRSHRTQKATTKKGQYLPMYSYSCTYFLDAKLTPHLTVFEYNPDSSTRYYLAKGLARVVGATIGKPPADLSTQRFGNRLSLHSVEDARAVPHAIHKTKERFHIVAVGNTERMGCILEGLKALREDGVLILNDSESEDTKEGIAYLHKQGFRHIHFQELRPLGYELFSTGIFYRPKNCLGI